MPYNEYEKICEGYCADIDEFDYSFNGGYFQFNSTSEFIDCACFMQRGDSDYLRNIQKKYDTILVKKILHLDSKTLEIVDEENIYVNSSDIKYKVETPFFEKFVEEIIFAFVLIFLVIFLIVRYYKNKKHSFFDAWTIVILLIILSLVLFSFRHPLNLS